MRHLRRRLGLGLAAASLIFLHAPDSRPEEGSETGQQEHTTIAPGRSVAIEYTLTLEDGTQVDSNVGEKPLRYEQGAQQIIPGLENALLGLAAGDQKKVVVAPEEGYGPVDPEAFQEVALSDLPEDGREAGALLVAQDPAGRMRQIRVHEVKGETAVLDYNHPLAGKKLIFEIKVLEVE